MKNTLLGVIAVCLFMITLKLYIPEAHASAYLDYKEANEAVYNKELRDFIRSTVEGYCRAENRISREDLTVGLVTHVYRLDCDNFFFRPNPR